MTPERAKELIATLDDDSLIDIAKTASRKDIRMAAEIHLRKRYPLTDEELTADDNWCPDCGDPREACLCGVKP